MTTLIKCKPFYLSSTLQFLVCSIDVVVCNGLEASRRVVEAQQTGAGLFHSGDTGLHSSGSIPADGLRPASRLVEFGCYHVSIYVVIDMISIMGNILVIFLPLVPSFYSLF